MATDLGFRLKQHFYNMLANNLKSEIGYQIEDNWGGYFGRIITAQDLAMKNQAQGFKDANREQEDENRKHERAFAVFNFFKGVALSWVGATLQYRVLNSYFKRTDWIPDGESVAGNFTYKLVESEDKVAAKVFGDIGKDVAGSFGTLGLGNFFNASARFDPPDSMLVGRSPTLEAFRQNLNTVIAEQRQSAEAAIDDIANKIENDVSFGDKLADSLRVTAIDDNESIENLEARGQRAINLWLNGQRQRWAASWKYYGNDPPDTRLDILSNHMEKEMWVLWMLEKKDLSSNQITDMESGELVWMDSLMQHMNELNLPTVTYLTVDPHTRGRIDAFEHFRNWCRKHKPEDPTWARFGTPRALPSIELWRPPKKSSVRH